MSQAPMARHPSREQLIDYLMLKVSHQPQGPPRMAPEALQQEVRASGNDMEYTIRALLKGELESVCSQLKTYSRSRNIISIHRCCS